MKENCISTQQNMLSVLEQADIDPEGYLEAGQEDFEERIYTLDGRPITDGSTSE